LSTALAQAGLKLIALESLGSRLPPAAARLITSCSSADGRSDIEIRRDDPQIVEKLNGAWWEVASRNQLLDRNSQLLLSVDVYADDPVPMSRWARVQLLPTWDLAGVGALRSPLGVGIAGLPDFTMMAMDERVVVAASVYEDFVSVMAVPDMQRLPAVLSYIRWRCQSPATSLIDKLSFRAWLDRLAAMP
jgi:hypothetical protein